MRIEQTGEEINYIARPSGNTGETPFKLIKWANNEYVFENKEHDFPQRVIYRQQPDKSLLARIEGTNNGKTMGIDFRSSRVKCEP